MGLHTTYVGHVVIDPPLSVEEIDFVRRFGNTRHYDAGDSALRLALHPADDDSSAASDALSYNTPAPGMPGLWCPWTVCKDGCCLRWDGIEKPYDGLAWLRYLIDEFLRDGARSEAAQQYGLTRNHVLDGMVVGERHETGELFAIVVQTNEVSRRTLVPRRPGVDEYGYGPEAEERRERADRLAARRRRYEAALAEDRAVAN